MLPKLKGDTFFIPTPDGIYFRNNQGSLKIKGKVVYRWIESLAPYLTGEHTLAKITTGLDSEKQAMVTDLVNTLLTNGFLKDLSQDLPHHLSPTERETYAAEIAFIDSFCDSAAARFERFREQQVLLIGSGLTLTGLVKALLKSGLRQVAVMTTPECETNTHRHQEYLDLFHKGDPRQTLKNIDAPVWENEAEVLAVLQPYDTIIHVSDRPMLARASMLNRLCVIHKKNLIQATIVDDHAWVGPLVRGQGQAAVPTGCWECAMLRLQGNLTNMREQLPAYAFQDQTTAPISHFVALPISGDATRRLHILEQIGGSVTVYDVTGPLQVPTFALCLGDQTVAYGTHVDAVQALQDGFEQAVLYKQLSGEQILVDNLPGLPLALRGEKRTEANTAVPTISDGTSQEWPDLKIWLQDVLQMNGWRAFAVPLDHDPVLREIRPYIVHVLVARA